MKGRQLPLAVQLRDTASFETFYAGPNEEALSALRGSESLLLYGPAGSGKTHLLHALARKGAAYLPLREFASHGPDTLEGFSSHSILLLDDADAVTADLDWALALLRLFDSRRTSSARTIIAARTPPEHADFALTDLRTRLNTLALYGLKPLDQGQRANILRERAQLRGLQVPDEVMHWMLTRLPRDTGSLLAALEKLDRASLSQKRRLTLPLAQQVLGAPAPADAHKA